MFADAEHQSSYQVKGDAVYGTAYQDQNVTCDDFYVKLCFPDCSEYVMQVQ